jgi:hypothetical protein
MRAALEILAQYTLLLKTWAQAQFFAKASVRDMTFSAPLS